MIKNGEIKEGRFGLSCIIKTEEGICLLADVAKGSPAEIAGIQIGDQILEYNGIKIASMNSFINYINLMEPGDILILKICRNNECFFVTLKKQEF
ncbi:MAG: PDZ domain-containing protein [Parachlamydiales bacterium]